MRSLIAAPVHWKRAGLYGDLWRRGEQRRRRERPWSPILAATAPMSSPTPDIDEPQLLVGACWLLPTAYRARRLKYLDRTCCKGPGITGSARAPSSRGLTPTARASLGHLEGGNVSILLAATRAGVRDRAAGGRFDVQKVSFRHDYDGLGDVALGDTTGPSGRIGLRTKWTIVTAGRPSVAAVSCG